MNKVNLEKYVSRMRCPYCDWVFGLTENRLRNNSTFTCPNCHKSNQGSVEADENGILIGEKTVSWAVTT